MIAATNDVLERQPNDVIRVLRTIHDICDDFMRDESAVTQVSTRYQQTPRDTERWFNSTEWSIHGWVSDKMIQSVVYHLKIAGIIDADQPIPELIWKR